MSWKNAWSNVAQFNSDVGAGLRDAQHVAADFLPAALQRPAKGAADLLYTTQANLMNRGPVRRGLGLRPVKLRAPGRVLSPARARSGIKTARALKRVKLP